MYESFYKLTGKPFELTPDPRFFYASGGHKRALAFLRYGINRGEGFIVITGEVGTGKTTLVQSLLAALSANKSFIGAHVMTTRLDAEDLLRTVTAAFGLAPEGLAKSALLKGMNDFFAAQAGEGRRALLVMDEVQNLPLESLEELRLLSNYQFGKHPLLQSVLVGQADLHDTLRSDRLEQLRQRVIVSYHLGPLHLDETCAYIKHRLGVVGWKGDPAFSTLAFNLIHTHTGGVPRRINLLCDRLLLYGYLQGIHEITEDAVRLVVRELSEESFTAVPEQSPAKQNGQFTEGPLDQRLADLERRLAAVENVMDRASELLQQWPSAPEGAHVSRRRVH